MHQGAPELKTDARYNQDLRYISHAFQTGMDNLVIYAETKADGCIEYDNMAKLDRLVAFLKVQPNVLSVNAITEAAKRINVGWHEGYLKWYNLPRNQAALAETISPLETSSGLLNHDCSVMPIHISLSDHQGKTLQELIISIQKHLAEDQSHHNSNITFKLAGGNAGILAATDSVVAAAQLPILASVYAAVFLLCLLMFRSLAAAICIILPLCLVSVLGYTIMYYLDIGLKVSTLPVIALGAGIGVDYAIYLLTYLRNQQAKNSNLKQSFISALNTGGSAILTTALTLSIGIGLWIFSELRYQADMGLLLSSMLLMNMISALCLVPALYTLSQLHRQTTTHPSSH